jgi:hypothetical protein
MRMSLERRSLAVLALLTLAACGAPPSTESEQAAGSDLVVRPPLPVICGYQGDACCSRVYTGGFGPPVTIYTCNSGLTCQSGTCEPPPAPPPPVACGYAGEPCCANGTTPQGLPNYDSCNDGSLCQTWSGPQGICAPQENPNAPVMHNPQVVAIYWGTDYYGVSYAPPFYFPVVVPNQRASILGTMLTDLLGPSYLTGEAQYGVSPGSVVESVYIQEAPPPVGSHLTFVDLQNKIVALLNGGQIAHKPGVNETNLLYFLFPPPDVELWLDSVDHKTDGTQGKHFHTHYNAASTRDDLIWTAVKTYNKADPSQAGSVSDVAGHEMVESFNDPLGGRFEVGDLCDGQNGGPAIAEYTLPGTGFQVQEYWSARDLACIRGDQP